MHFVSGNQWLSVESNMGAVMKRVTDIIHCRSLGLNISKHNRAKQAVFDTHHTQFLRQNPASAKPALVRKQPENTQNKMRASDSKSIACCFGDILVCIFNSIWC